MERVMARRDENWKKLQQNVLDERGTLVIDGPTGARLFGHEVDYTWFVRDGFFVRSPVRVNGVAVGESERRAYEARWLRREQQRERRTREAATEAGAETGGDRPQEPGGRDVLRQTLEPYFVRAAYFLRFKFDPGQYALVGRERLMDRDVLRIEYYPTRLFEEGRTKPDQRARDRDEDVEEKMNKVSLVTLWIDAERHQILQYTFDIMGFDFLPGRSIARVDDVGASMRMGEPFEGVWLPQDLAMRFRLLLATGPVEARYDLRYRNYRLADVKTRIVPGG